MTAEQILDRIYELLGEAVLLPIPLGEKGPKESGWQELTFAESQKRRDKLLEVVKRGGNLGVLLGPKSNRLLALDLDSDQLVDTWLVRHPWLANTMRTFRVLCAVINGFNLGPEDALSAALYYNRKCEPSWSEKDLKHKVDDALRAERDKPHGYLLEGDFSSNAPPSSKSGPRTDGETKSSEPGETEQAASDRIKGLDIYYDSSTRTSGRQTIEEVGFESEPATSGDG